MANALLAPKHDAAAVELVAQDAAPPGHGADERRGVPLGSRGRRNAVSIERARHVAVRPAFRDLGEDSPHHGRFGLVDPAHAAGVAARNHVVAVSVAARDPSVGDRGPLAAADLVREVREIERVHRSLETNPQRIDGPFRDGNELDLMIAQALEDHRDVGLVTTHPRQVLNQHGLELAIGCGGDERHDPRAVLHDGAGDSLVGELIDDRGALAARDFPASVELGGDGTLLRVRRVARVDRHPDARDFVHFARHSLVAEAGLVSKRRQTPHLWSRGKLTQGRRGCDSALFQL